MWSAWTGGTISLVSRGSLARLGEEAGVDTPEYIFTNSMKQAQFNAGGELWDVPAGAIQLSAGGLYRQQTMNYSVTQDAILNLAVSPALEGRSGLYFNRKQETRANAQAYDAAARKRLHELSLKLTGLPRD